MVRLLVSIAGWQELRDRDARIRERHGGQCPAARGDSRRTVPAGATARASEDFHAVLPEVHDPHLRHPSRRIDSELGQAVLLERGVGHLDDEQCAGWMGLEVIPLSARDDGDIGLRNGISAENQRQLNPDRRLLADRSYQRPADATDDSCMPRILGRHRHHRPFQQLDAIVGLEQSLVDQRKITIARGPSGGQGLCAGRALHAAKAIPRPNRGQARGFDIQKIVLRKRIELLPFVRRSRDNGGSRDPRR